MSTLARTFGLTAFVGGLVLVIMPQGAEAASVTVTIQNSQYSPRSVTVNPGDSITWINRDSMPHTVTDGAGAFNSGTIAPGESYTITVQVPAQRTYRCEFHPGMTGTITVNAPTTGGTTSGAVNTTVNTTNTNADALAAQAESLLQQIAALQAQLAGQTTGAATGATASSAAVTSNALCPLIGRVLKLGSSGNDVSRLQTFLAADPSIYPERLVTGYYGPLTEAAVKRWQTRYNIVSSGTPESTGFGVVGPRTAAAISLQCSTSSGGGGSTITTPTVGGFIQVTPVTGNAPLTASVIATVNTVHSCQAATYVLDWGDGTIAQNINVPAGNCGQIQQTYSHIYLYGGTYQIRLSAGQHSTSATVQVFGAAGPVTPPNPAPTTQNPSINLTAPSGGQSASLGGTLGVSWSSQNAPAGSKVRLELYKSSDNVVQGNNDRGLASNASELPPSGSFTWAIPNTDACLADAGHVSCIQSGQYKIVAKLYSGSTCWGFCSGTNTRTIHGTDDSGVFTIGGGGSSSFSFGPLGVNPGVSGNPFAVAVSFNIPSSCTGYSINWGDGSTLVTQAHATSCAQTPVTRIFSHEYASGGTFTITLRRGASLSQVDTASVTISN